MLFYVEGSCELNGITYQVRKRCHGNFDRKAAKMYKLFFFCLGHLRTTRIGKPIAIIARASTISHFVKPFNVHMNHVKRVKCMSFKETIVAPDVVRLKSPAFTTDL